MHALFSKHPALWRAMAGLILGFALEVLIFVLVDVAPIETLILFVAAPVFALQIAIDAVGLSDSFLAVLLSLFFFPVLFAAVGFLSGERQTKAIVAIEVILAVVVIACWVYGGYILTFILD